MYDLSKSAKDNMKNIVESLDINAPKVDEPNWAIFESMLGQVDFTKNKNVMEDLNMFYREMWRHVIFPLEDELNAKNREIGRLIIEADSFRREAKKATEELEDLRKRFSKESDKEA